MKCVAFGAALAFAVAFAQTASAQLAAPPPIDPASVTYYSGSGTASVSGRVVASLPGDRTRYFDKWQVFLIPVVPYTHYYEHLVIDGWKNNGGAVAPADPVWLKMSRATFSDDNGYFVFRNLPSKGVYFVFAAVSVKDGRQETAYATSYEQTGTTTYLSDGIPIGMVPNFDYVSHPYQHDYTCLSQGLIGGAVEIKNGEAAGVNLGLYAERNDGC